MLSGFFPGFFLGATLIIAIGAQNAFILRQGLLKQHVFVLCLICALSDSLLITLGVLGFGSLIQQSQTALLIVTFAGALFLITYGILAFRRALKPSAMEKSDIIAASLSAAISTCLALTFLNPHVYLDTVVLLGGISSNYEGAAQFRFGVGAVIASFVWFFALGYGARFLLPVFQNPKSWQILDGLIAIIMWLIALKLVWPYIFG